MTLTAPIPLPTVSLGTMKAEPKILLYSHDTAGLGNIRRTLLISEAILQEYPRAAILIVTGSPMIHAFRIPTGIDYIKLPCLDRVAAERYEPRFLGRFSREIKRTRREMLRMAVGSLEPDLMIVDKRPTGIDGELVDAIERLQAIRPDSKLVLGIRDVLDERIRTRQALRRSGAFDVIRSFYDEVWIYGAREVYDTAGEYSFPPQIRGKTHYCGYLQRTSLPSDVPERNGHPPRVLVTTGGGGDGSKLIETYLEGLSNLPRRRELRTTVVFGPQMPCIRQQGLRMRFGHLADVEFVEFDAHLERHYAQADVVVCMAGYNTICELLSFGLRAVLVPRAEPVLEQTIRARRFHDLGFFEIVEPSTLGPDVLIEKTLNVLKPSSLQRPEIDLGGLPRIRARVRALLNTDDR